MSKNGELRIFGPKREKLRMSRVVDTREFMQDFTRKSRGKLALGRPICRWKNNIQVENVDWIHLVQDTDQWQALVNTVIKL